MTPGHARGGSRDPRRRCPSLDEALSLVNARTRDWSPAPHRGPVTLLGPLMPEGSSNHSFLVQAGRETLVLRLDGIDPARNAINRKTEFQLQSAAAAEGLAPQPRFCDADAGVLLVDYIPPDANASTGSVTDLGNLLRAVHGLNIVAPRLSLAARLGHYERLLPVGHGVARELLGALSGPLQAACSDIEQDPGAGVVCHNDLTRANRLYHRGRLFALDWEYAAHGSRWFDLAVAADHAFTAHELLPAYLQRLPSARESALFARATLIARYLELLWLACNAACEVQTVCEGLRELRARVDAMTTGHTTRAP